MPRQDPAATSVTRNMTPRSCRVLLATFILFVIHTNTSPTFPVNSTNLNAIKVGVNCFHPTATGGRRAETLDCLQAALNMPEGADPGSFHNGNLMDDYKLPEAKPFQSCVASVSIAEDTVDRSSWDHISYVASQIAVICSVGNFPLGRTGGVMYVGTDGHICVTVEKATPMSLGGGGSTNLTGTS